MAQKKYSDDIATNARSVVDKLKHERTRAGMNCEAMAQQSGVAVTTIYNLESRMGVGGTQFSTVLQYAHALGFELRLVRPRS